MSDGQPPVESPKSVDSTALGRLLPQVYDELRRLAEYHLAREQPGHSLSATALTNEALLRILGSGMHFESAAHLISTAARNIRWVLINRARERHTQKRGRIGRHLRLEDIDVAYTTPTDELLSINEAIERLEAEDPESAKLVELKFYGALTMDEAARALGISQRTAERLWTFARAWLFDALKDDGRSA